MEKQFLPREMVETQVVCRTWKQAVEACGRLLVKGGKVEEVFVDSMIKVVEEMGPYMILLPEVAFFHGRPSEAVHEACLSLITLKEPVVFEEFDGQIIKAAFGFGAVDNNSHIDMLTKIFELLQDDTFLDLLLTQGSKEEIMAKLSQSQGSKEEIMAKLSQS